MRLTFNQLYLLAWCISWLIMCLIRLDKLVLQHGLKPLTVIDCFHACMHLNTTNWKPVEAKELIYSGFDPLTESSPDFPMDSHNLHCRGPNGGNLSVYSSLTFGCFAKDPSLTGDVLGSQVLLRVLLLLSYVVGKQLLGALPSPSELDCGLKWVILRTLSPVFSKVWFISIWTVTHF